YEINRLKTLLLSRTTTSDVGEENKANIYTNSHVLRLKASTSGPLNKHVMKGIKPISIPRPTPLLMSSHSAWELERSNRSKMAGNSRSSILYDPGSGGLMRRIWPIANCHPTPSLISLRTTNDFEVLDDDNHSTTPLQGNAPTTNAAYTLAPTVEPPQKKHAFQDFEVLYDDNHSTSPVQGNAPTTYAPTTYAALSLALPRIYLEYDDPPQKKLRLSFSYNQ
nr:nuclear pore complex protein NUP1-like isoform X1 [Tanacetum cinerariifolium]